MANESKTPGAKSLPAKSVGTGRFGWLKTAQTRRLLRLVAFLILISAVGTAYFLLANQIDDIHDATAKMATRSAELERENSALMAQVAAWNRPDAIMANAPEKGLAPGPGPVYAQIADPSPQAQAAPRPNDVAGWWRQLVQDVARRWSGVTRTAEAPAGAH